MSDLKWEDRSADLRKGWRYGQGDTEIVPQFDSVEFCDGYRYALKYPVGAIRYMMQQQVKMIDGCHLKSRAKSS